ncbi:MAG: HAD-IA family hydrolase, partial [Candidatus Krumholzibacteriia bacterium]
MTVRPAAFIFDLDGTLVDSGLDVALAANGVRVTFGLPELPVPVLVGYVGDGVGLLLERALGHDLAGGQTGQPVAAARLAEAHAVFADLYGRHLLDNTRLYPGVRSVLARFADLPLHLATNKPRAFTDAILDGLGLDGVFRRIVGGDEAPARKPDPAHLAACLAGLAVAPGRVVVVGDSPNDVLAARGLGA